MQEHNLKPLQTAWLHSWLFIGRLTTSRKLQLRFGLRWRLVAALFFLYGRRRDFKLPIRFSCRLLIHCFLIRLVFLHRFLNESPVKADTQSPCALDVTIISTAVFPPQFPAMLGFDCYSTFRAVECQATGFTFLTGFPAPRTNFMINALCPVTMLQLPRIFIDVDPIECGWVIGAEGYKT